jgi:general secretion pathway protein D
MATKSARISTWALAPVLFALGSCASQPPNISGYRPPTERAKPAESSSVAAQGEADSAKAAKRRSETDIPGVPQAPPKASDPQKAPEQKTIKPTKVAFDGAPVPVFINAVFAETLKFAVRIDPALAARTETITLKTGDPVSAQDLFDISAAALKDYGIEVIVESPRTLRFTTVDRQRGGAPQVFRGGQIPGSAATGDGKIYYFYSLKAASLNSLVTTLNNTFAAKLQLNASPLENAILMSGAPDVINSALDMLQSFDQPRMAGKKVTSVEPVFFQPSKLADALSRVLRTAGYSVSTTPDAAAVNVLPLDEVGVLLVYAADDAVRAFALDWVKQLDEPRNVSGESQAFVYFVENTDADSMARVLSSALGGSGGQQPSRQQQTAPSAPMTTGAQPQGAGAAQVGATVTAGGLRIAVDPGRNALIIMGKAEQYAGIVPLLRQLDRSAGEVLIEVVLAEITITDKTSLGVDFELGNRLKTGDVKITGATQGGLGVGSSGVRVLL